VEGKQINKWNGTAIQEKRGKKINVQNEQKKETG
jgi:hypothetical protein